jgi:hypothetical protein
MDDLNGLKNQILDDLIKVVDEDGLDPAERFEIIMARYDVINDNALLAKAYEAAKAIEDIPTRGNALMQILEEINIAQSETANTEAAPQVPEQPAGPTQQTPEQPAEAMPQQVQ